MEPMVGAVTKVVKRSRMSVRLFVMLNDPLPRLLEKPDVFNENAVKSRNQ